MAEIIWPNALPSAPLLRELSETAPNTTIRTSMDVGPAKIRRRQTVAPRMFNVIWSMTRNQVATFDEFYTITTLGGSEPWEYTHPRTGATVDFRFASVPTYKPLSPRINGAVDRWEVSCTLEVLPAADPIEPEEPITLPAMGAEAPDWLTTIGGEYVGEVDAVADPGVFAAAEFADVFFEADEAKVDQIPALYEWDNAYVAPPGAGEGAPEDSTVTLEYGDPLGQASIDVANKPPLWHGDSGGYSILKDGGILTPINTTPIVAYPFQPGISIPWYNLPTSP